MSSLISATTASPTIAIAGGSGYIGRALIARLLERFPQAKIIALSRSGQAPGGDPRVLGKPCDLFSLRSLEEALPPIVDAAFYLVHSMGPTAALDQGSFADYDLILADNFARALQGRSIKHVLYLGGLVPATQALSLHLRSRLEVEETLQSQGLPLTIFRAGLILGKGGSSSEILLRLVQRLPIMACPRWTQTLTTPVNLEQVIGALTISVFDPATPGQIYDLTGCRPLSYLEMMRATARHLGVRRLFIKVPFFTPTLSRLWVTLITGASKDLVYPLVESLEHEMVARPSHLFPQAQAKSPGDYAELLKRTDLGSAAWGTLGRPTWSSSRAIQRRTVRSVQRLPLPTGRDAVWLKNEYLRWLPRFLAPLIRVLVQGETVRFCALRRSWTLLELEFSPERSTPDRQLLYIRGGWLVATGNRGRLEFRSVLHHRSAIAAIHDFSPALPWFVYRYTQALLHLWVMRSFRRYLGRV